MAYQALEVNRDGAIAWLTLNRPQTLNALNAAMVDELHDYLRELYHDRKTRVVVMRGAGRAFCAGLDLKEQSGRLARPAARPGVVRGKSLLLPPLVSKGVSTFQVLTLLHNIHRLKFRACLWARNFAWCSGRTRFCANVV